MNAKELAESRNLAFQAIHQYLTDCGWKQLEFENDLCFFYRVDPITGCAHRGDFAFIVQTERDIGKPSGKKQEG